MKGSYDKCALFEIIRYFPSLVFHCRKKDDLGKWNYLAMNKPDVNHLDVRGGGQASILVMKMVVITSMVTMFIKQYNFFCLA